MSKLKETSMMIDAWIATGCKPWDGFDDFAEVARDWAKIEWGEETTVEFDFENKKAIVASGELRKEFTSKSL